MALSRYEIIDTYTLEELKREYLNDDAKGRITLLKKFYEQGKIPPYEIVLLAVEDPDAQVRQWIAKSGRLEYAEGNLAERLKNDPDPFVRACLWENPSVFTYDLLSERGKQQFREATHLERLALVRNPELGYVLIMALFDPQETELGIDLAERQKLVLASFTNESVSDFRYELWDLAFK